MQTIYSKIIMTFLLSFILAACAGHAPAPVIDIGAGNTSWIKTNASKPVSNSYVKNSVTGIHTVKPGETLFSIAWRYSLDFTELANINHVKGHRIYPGQQLNLQSSEEIFHPDSLLAAINKEILNKKVVKRREVSLASNHGVVNNTPSSNNRISSKKSYSNKHSAKVSIANSNSRKATNRRKPSNKTFSKAATSTINNSVKHWIWPVNGKIINHFSKRLNSNKGVDISAKHGSPVRAAAKGKVVYSGKGLRGYGRLVIIKHNDAFLSAYAHNDKLHVEQDEFVKAGQRIADLGSSDSDKDKLHFEIRYKGKPVDPLNYLPKSGI